jgi:putative transposase
MQDNNSKDFMSHSKNETTLTYREDFTLPAELLERVPAQGLDVLPELIRTIINHAMLAEREQHLHAEPSP